MPTASLVNFMVAQTWPAPAEARSPGVAGLLRPPEAIFTPWVFEARPADMALARFFANARAVLVQAASGRAVAVSGASSALTLLHSPVAAPAAAGLWGAGSAALVLAVASASVVEVPSSVVILGLARALADERREHEELALLGVL